jgi:hypothetical protein
MDDSSHRFSDMHRLVGLTPIERLARLEAERQEHLARDRYLLVAEHEASLAARRAALTDLAAREEDRRQALERATRVAPREPAWFHLLLSRATLGPSAQALGPLARSVTDLVAQDPLLFDSMRDISRLVSGSSGWVALQEMAEARRLEALASPHWLDAVRLAELSAGLGSALSRMPNGFDELAQRLALGKTAAFRGHWDDPSVAAGLARASGLSSLVNRDRAGVLGTVLGAAGEFRGQGPARGLRHDPGPSDARRRRARPTPVHRTVFPAPAHPRPRADEAERSAKRSHA